MKKLNAVRMSGLPVDIEYLKKFQEEWKEAYDKLVIKCRVKGSKPAANGEYPVDALTLSKKAEKLENKLFKKYPNTEKWDFLKTEKEWKDRIDEYEAPIMLAFDQKKKNLVYVIMDQPIL